MRTAPEGRTSQHCPRVGRNPRRDECVRPAGAGSLERDAYHGLRFASPVAHVARPFGAGNGARGRGEGKGRGEMGRLEMGRGEMGRLEMGRGEMGRLLRPISGERGVGVGLCALCAVVCERLPLVALPLAIGWMLRPVVVVLFPVIWTLRPVVVVLFSVYWMLCPVVVFLFSVY
jgi:hypothetical protein